MKPLNKLLAITVALIAGRNVLPEGPAVASTPTAHIVTEMKNGKLSFSFRECKTKESFRVHGLIVASADEKKRYCALRTEIEGGERLLVDWEYGAAPNGFRLMECLPLRRGGDYTISVVGSAAGTGYFRIDSQGAVIPQGGTCVK